MNKPLTANYKPILILITLALFFFAAGGVFAQQAVIRDLAGTVEVKQAGSAKWEAASRGQALKGDTSISTGFRSTALIAIGDSLITVRPLTRMTLTELTRAQNAEKISLNLETGRVRVEVKAIEGGKTDFTVRSSAATASVRGTVFEFDTFNLTVSEGTVEFLGGSGAPVMVDAGSASRPDDRTGRPAAQEDTFVAELRPQLPIASDTIKTGDPVTGDNSIGIAITISF